MSKEITATEYNVTESVASAPKKPLTTPEAPKHYASPAFRARWAESDPPHPMDSLEEWNRSQWESWKAAQVRASGSYSTGSFAGKAK